MYIAALLSVSHKTDFPLTSSPKERREKLKAFSSPQVELLPLSLLLNDLRQTIFIDVQIPPIPVSLASDETVNFLQTAC